MHPVDELAEVRAAIKALQALEAELKAAVSAAMGSGDALFGDGHVAFQKLTSRKGSIDTAAMAKAGIDIEPFRKADVPVLTIVVERVEQKLAA